MRVLRRLTAVAAIAVVVLSVTAAAAFALPGNPGAIAGTVTDSVSLAGIGGVTVEVWDDPGTGMAYTGYSVQTGFSGDYLVTGLPAGTYDLHAYDPSKTHRGALAQGIVVADTQVATDIALDPAGYFSGTVRDNGTPGSPLPEAKVFLYGMPGFPLPPDYSDPDPYTATADGSGDFTFWEVVEPFNDEILSGDYTLGAFEPEHLGQFYDLKATPGVANKVTMDVGSELPGLDFYLANRSRLALPAKTVVNAAGSTIPSNKQWVRRAGDSWALWYDDAAGGLVLRALPQNATGAEYVLATDVDSYDGAWDVNGTDVFLGDGRVIDASTRAVSATLDIDGATDAVVSCDDEYAAYLYEIASTDFRTRTWRLRVFELTELTGPESTDFVRPMDHRMRLQPGGTSGGLTAVTSSPEVPSEGATSAVLAFDYDTAVQTTVTERVSTFGLDACESAIVVGNYAIYVDQDAGEIIQDQVDGPDWTQLVDETDDPTGGLSDITGDGSEYFLYAFSHDMFAFDADSVIRFFDVNTGTSIDAVAVAPSFQPFEDYDYVDTPDFAAILRGAAPTDMTHVYTTYIEPFDPLRIDADRFLPADQQAPDVSGQDMVWLDWRTHAGPYSPDVYHRRLGGAEEIIATEAYDYSQDIGLPRVSGRWLVYAMPFADPARWWEAQVFAHDLVAGGIDRLVTTVSLQPDGDPDSPQYYAPLCSVSGDWFVWTGGADRTAQAELHIKNIATSAERVVTTVDTPSEPFAVYFKASNGKVLYEDGEVRTRLYDIATDTDQIIATLPLRSSFDAFAFDYPRAAFIDPLYENPSWTDYRGTLKAVDFRTGATTVLEPFFYMETARMAGKPLSIYRHALIAGSHVYDLTTGQEYGFGPASELPSFASIDGTRAVVEAPEGAGVEADIYALDLSSFVDVTPPTTSVSGVPSGLSTTPVVLEFSATDTGSGVDYIQIRQDPPGNVTTVTTSFYLTPVEGTQTITYTSVDNWGNWDVEHTALIVYDRPPVTTLEIDSGATGLNGWYRSSVAFHLSAADTGSGLAATWISIDGAPPVLYDGGSRYLDTDGTHTVEYWSVDNHGTVEEHHIDTFKVDQTKPTVTASLPSYSIFEGSQTITITVTDLTSGPMGVDVQKDTDAFSSLYMPAPYVDTMTTPGLHGYYYAGRDLAGNIEPLPGTTYQVWARGYAESTPTTGFSFSMPLSPGGWYSGAGTAGLWATDIGPDGLGSGIADSFYTLDGGAVTTYTAGFPISGDGTHTVTYWSVDLVGRVEPSNSVLVPIDDTGPTFISDAKPVYEGPATVTMSVSDALSGLREVQQWSGGSWGPVSVPLTFNDSAEGDYSRTFQAFDELDNQSDYTLAYSIRPLSLPESIATVSPAPYMNGWNRLSAPTVTITATDTAGGQPGSGVKSTYYRIGSTTTTYTAPFQVSTQGTTTIEYWSVDNVGNEETPHKTQVVKYDSVDPTVTHDGVAYYEGAGTITVTGHDSTSGPWRTEYMLAPAGGFSSGPDGEPVTFAVGAVGSHSFEYICTDWAGNMSTYGTHPSFSYFVGVVSTPVTSIGITPAANAAGWNATSVTISLPATDTAGGLPGSGVRTTYYRIGGGSQTAYAGPFLYSTEGVHTIEYWSVDNVGNEELPHQTRTFSLDRTRPTASFGAVSAFYEGTAHLTATAVDSVSSVPGGPQYKLDAGGWTPWPGGGFDVTALGSHMVWLNATDAAGNRAYDLGSEPSRSFFLGAVSTPSTTIGGVPAGTAIADVPITLTATDTAGGQPGSGIAATYYTLDGGSRVTYANSPFTVSKQGTTTVEYWSVDNVGNEEIPHKVAFVRINHTQLVPVYRFYNTRTGTHFYTASEAERTSVVANLWRTYRLEGVAYSLNVANPANSVPLYRFYNVKNGTHFYTASEAEKNSVVANLWRTYRLEGVAYRVSLDPSGGATPVYRFYNVKNGTHFYTASEAERNSVVANLWRTYRLEGVAYYLAP